MEFDPRHFCKSNYITIDGYRSTAYVDDRTNIGVDKHTDVPVKIFWSDEDGQYHEVEIMIPKLPDPPPSKLFIRVQSKRLSRKKRLHK